jgi:hypothetical protein
VAYEASSGRQQWLASFNRPPEKTDSNVGKVFGLLEWRRARGRYRTTWSRGRGGGRFPARRIASIVETCR